jgi:hypothetical protein
MKPEDRTPQIPGDEFADEFGPYLEEAMREPEFCAVYELATRLPTAFEETLRRNPWVRFYWRYLRRFDALVDRLRYESMFDRGHRAELDLGAAVAIAENWKGRIPW